MNNFKITIAFLFLLCFGCSTEESNMEFDFNLVNKRILEKQNDYRSVQLKICSEDAYRTANEKLDSIIAKELNLSLLDSIRFPNKPQKPIHPGEIKLDDSTLVEKIIK